MTNPRSTRYQCAKCRHIDSRSRFHSFPSSVKQGEYEVRCPKPGCGFPAYPMPPQNPTTKPKEATAS